MNYEEISRLASELIKQYAPQLEKYTFIIVGVICAIVLLAQIINTLVKFRNGNIKLKEISKPLELKTDIVSEIKQELLSKLTGTFEVDITDKLKPIVDELFISFNQSLTNLNDKITLIKELELALVNIFGSCTTLTSEEKARLEHVKQLAENLVDYTEKQPLTITLSAAEPKTIEEPQESKSKKSKVTI